MKKAHGTAKNILTNIFEKKEVTYNQEANAKKAVDLLKTVTNDKCKVEALTQVRDTVIESRADYSAELAATLAEMSKDAGDEVAKTALGSIIEIAKENRIPEQIDLSLKTLLEIAVTAQDKKAVCGAIMGAGEIFLSAPDHTCDVIHKSFQELRKSYTEKEPAERKSMIISFLSAVVSHALPPSTVNGALDRLQQSFDLASIDKFKKATNPKWGAPGGV